MSDSGTVVWFDGVTKMFAPGSGIEDVSLRILSGSVFAMLGANGAGKTTIINLCLGYLTADAGTVRVFDVDMPREVSGVRRRLAYVPEVARLYADMSPLENLQFFDELLGVSRTGEQYLQLLDEFGLSRSSCQTAVRLLSKGNRQRTAVALGVAKGADLFLLDEPASGLDPAAARLLSEAMKGLRSAGRTVVYSSHDVAWTMAVADTICVLAGGQVLGCRPAAQWTAEELETAYDETCERQGSRD